MTYHKLMLVLWVSLFTLTFRPTMTASTIDSNGLETRVLLPTVVQTAYQQSNRGGTFAQIESAVEATPPNERVSIILALLARKDGNADMRGQLAKLLFSLHGDGENVQKKHLLLLTQTYLSVTAKPLQPSAPVGRGAFTDAVIQTKLIDVLASLMGVQKEAIGIVYMGRPPTEWLNQLFLIAKSKGGDANSVSQIEACRALLDN